MLYCIIGDNQKILSEHILKFRQASNNNVNIYDGESSLEEIFTTIMNKSFLFPNKYVIIKDFDTINKDSLLKLLDKIPGFVDLLLVSEKEKIDSKIIKVINNKCNIKYCFEKKDFTVFDLVNSVVDKSLGKTLTVYKYLLNSGESNDNLLYFLNKYFTMLLLARSSSKYFREINKGAKEFYLSSCIRVSTRYTVSELLSIKRLLSGTIDRLHNRIINPDMLLYSTIFRLCGA